MEAKRIGDLEIIEDLQFQRNEWRAERIGWVAGLLILALAILGAFGNGPLATATESDETNALTVDHERIVRRLSPTDIAITVADGQPEVNLWIDRSFLNGVTVDTINPEPQEVTTTADRLVYRFALGSSEAPAVIHLALEHEDMGLVDVRIGLVDGPMLEFKELVLP